MSYFTEQFWKVCKESNDKVQTYPFEYFNISQTFTKREVEFFFRGVLSHLENHDVHVIAGIDYDKMCLILIHLVM